LLTTDVDGAGYSRNGSRSVGSASRLVRASLHTRRERVAEIVARAQVEHPYEVPGVSTRPIIDGNPDYLAWISKETDTSSGQAHGPAT